MPIGKVSPPRKAEAILNGLSFPVFAAGRELAPFYICLLCFCKSRRLAREPPPAELHAALDLSLCCGIGKCTIVSFYNIFVVLKDSAKVLISCDLYVEVLLFSNAPVLY